MIKAKLAQSLAWRNQCPLYQIYVDLKKAYNALDREQTLEILAAYGVRPRMLRLQKNFWDTAKLVCNAREIMGSHLTLRWALLRGAHCPLSC